MNYEICYYCLHKSFQEDSTADVSININSELTADKVPMFYHVKYDYLLTWKTRKDPE